MAGKKKSPWFYFGLMAALYLLLYILFVGEDYLGRMVETEQRYNAEFYTPELATASNQRATRWFNGLFVDTGIMAHTFDPFIPTQDEVSRAKGLEDFGQPIFHWFERRIRAWWTLVWSAIVRMSSVLLWAPFSLFLVAPWVIDGFVLREIRKNTFDFSSPIQQRYAMRAITMVPLLFMVFLAMPIPMHPLVTPLSLMAIGFLLQRTIANFMKRF